MQTICHDFKSPRSDGARRLPSIFMVVPIMFYVLLLGGGYMGVNSYMAYRDALKLRDIKKDELAGHEAKTAELTEAEGKIQAETRKAEKLAQWVEGTRAMQPVSVAIIRSVPAEITLGEISLERSMDVPQQINLGVRINNGTLQEVNRIQTALGALNYRSYNSQQDKAGEGGLQYRAMLVWQNQLGQ